MTDVEAFQAAINAAPEDSAPRLVFADWLDDNGRHDDAKELRRRWQTKGVKTILHLLDDDSWAKAFEYAGEKESGEYGRTDGVPDIHPAFPGSAVSVIPFGLRDVVEIIAIREGENDERNWVCVGRLFDGRWFALDAGCDYTGWD